MAVNKVELTNGNVLIDLTADTVTPETLAEGVIAHGADGEVKVGTMRRSEDLDADLTEQEDLIAVLQSTLKRKTAGSGEDVTSETNEYTVKLERLGVAIAALENELKNKASGSAELGTCTVRFVNNTPSNCVCITDYMIPCLEDGEIKIARIDDILEVFLDSNQPEFIVENAVCGTLLFFCSDVTEWSYIRAENMTIFRPAFGISVTSEVPGTICTISFNYG